MKLTSGCTIIAIRMFMGTSLPALGMEGGRYFSEHEIAAAYRYQENLGGRLRHSLKPQDCCYGKREFIASFQGKTFAAPCRFVTETTRQLKQMLENGAARYLFPLDADHAHLAVPAELWAEKYSKLSVGEVLPELLREPRLIALYHTAEHLALADLKHDSASGLTQKWRAKRNVLGLFDGSPVKILPPRPDGSAHNKPERYENVGNVYFLAHRLGEITFSANGKAVSFDISFDDDDGSVMP